eukprot:53469-Amphidinium_carterae.2
MYQFTPWCTCADIRRERRSMSECGSRCGRLRPFSTVAFYLVAPYETTAHDSSRNYRRTRGSVCLEENTGLDESLRRDYEPHQRREIRARIEPPSAETIFDRMNETTPASQRNLAARTNDKVMSKGRSCVDGECLDERGFGDNAR